MTSKKTTRRALFSSVIALILCCSMLVGTTFAWFTDEVKSMSNIITAGNLDVDVVTADGNTIHNQATLFNEITKWEPGVVAYETLTVKNLGTLALKYQMALNFTNATATPDGKTLADVLKVGVVNEAVAEGTTREQLLAKVTTWQKMESFSVNGQLEAGKDAEPMTLVIYWEPNVLEDNDYNMNNGQTTVLSIDLGVNVFATQLQAEEDSFGPDYDAGAQPLPWDGSIGEVPAEVDGVITIQTAEELAALAADVNAGNTYAGKTVQLGADIDLGNKAWTPIGLHTDLAGFQGTFDGQGHTIYNLFVNQSEQAYQSAGLFGSARYATIKNFKVVNANIINLDIAGNSANGAAVVVGAAQFTTTIDNVDVENATVTGNRRVSAIAGYYVGTITNCDVKNVNLVATFDDLGTGYDNADKVGMIIAYSNGASTITNNTVTGGSILGYRDIGGIAGYATSSTLTDNKVENLSIVVNAEHNYKNYADLAAHDAHEIVGEGTADASNVATNVTVEKTINNVADLADAIANAADGATVTVGVGNFTIPSTVAGKTITLVGAGENTVIDFTQAYNVSNAVITFKNLHIQGTNANVMSGFGIQHTTGHIAYENCTFDGAVTNEFYGTVSYKNCTFTGTGYITTYAVKSANFENCVFDKADSRAMLVYSHGNNPCVVTLTDCVFQAAAKATTWNGDWTAAVEIDTTNITSAGTSVTINNCTADENYSGLLRDKSGAGKANAVITVNGQTWAFQTAQLKNALSVNAENIDVVVAGDISIDIGTGWGMGGADTESITINGNGNTVTLSSTYRSYFKMANPNGKLYLEDMVLTNAHKGTHFFDYTTHFNCDVVATEVNFAKSPLVDSGVTAEFTDCAFTQAGNDIYGLWIMSGSNVTVNGGELTTDRGFKIADEDSAAELTVLNVSKTKFSNIKKAAILVTTAHGATITLDNVDIANCAADSTNAVWLDEDRVAYASTVTVTGGSIINEP